MVRKLVGRGVMDIPMGCTAITNKAIFTEVKPADLILEQNISLPLPSFPNLHGYNIQQIHPLEMDLYPTNLKQEGTQLIGSGRTWGLSAIIAAAGVTTLLLFSIVSYIILFRKSLVRKEGWQASKISSITRELLMRRGNSEQNTVKRKLTVEHR